jgi:hypothetical protein
MSKPTIESFIEEVVYKEGYNCCGFLFVECYAYVAPATKAIFDSEALVIKAVDDEPLPLGCHHHYTVDTLAAARKKLKAQAYDKCIAGLIEKLGSYIRMLFVKRQYDMSYFIAKTEYREKLSEGGFAIECIATLIRMPGFDIHGLTRIAKKTFSGPCLESWLYENSYNQVVHELKPLIDAYIIQLGKLALALKGDGNGH